MLTNEARALREKAIKLEITEAYDPELLKALDEDMKTSKDKEEKAAYKAAVEKLESLIDFETTIEICGVKFKLKPFNKATHLRWKAHAKKHEKKASKEQAAAGLKAALRMKSPSSREKFIQDEIENLMDDARKLNKKAGNEKRVDEIFEQIETLEAQALEAEIARYNRSEAEIKDAGGEGVDYEVLAKELAFSFAHQIAQEGGDSRTLEEWEEVSDGEDYRLAALWVEEGNLDWVGAPQQPTQPLNRAQRRAFR